MRSFIKKIFVLLVAAPALCLRRAANVLKCPQLLAVAEDAYLLIRRQYAERMIGRRTTRWFTPNSMTRYRVESLYEKEPETLAWIDGFRDSAVFWDIGANIGLYSVYAAVVKPGLDIFAFEPSPNNIGCLAENISLNGLGARCRIVPMALSVESTFAVFRESNDLEGGALNAFGVDYGFDGKKIRPRLEFSILGSSADDLVKHFRLPVPNYVKIDVDGIEHLVLRGMAETLENRSVESVLIELNREFDEQYRIVMEIMASKGFHAVNESVPAKGAAGKFASVGNYIFTR